MNKETEQARNDNAGLSNLVSKAQEATEYWKRKYGEKSDGFNRLNVENNQLLQAAKAHGTEIETLQRQLNEVSCNVDKQQLDLELVTGTNKLLLDQIQRLDSEKSDAEDHYKRESTTRVAIDAELSAIKSKYDKCLLETSDLNIKHHSANHRSTELETQLALTKAAHQRQVEKLETDAGLADGLIREKEFSEQLTIQYRSEVQSLQEELAKVRSVNLQLHGRVTSTADNNRKWKDEYADLGNIYRSLGEMYSDNLEHLEALQARLENDNVLNDQDGYEGDHIVIEENDPVDLPQIVDDEEYENGAFVNEDPGRGLAAGRDYVFLVQGTPSTGTTTIRVSQNVIDLIEE